MMPSYWEKRNDEAPELATIDVKQLAYRLRPTLNLLHPETRDVIVSAISWNLFQHNQNFDPRLFLVACGEGDLTEAGKQLYGIVE